MIILLFFFACTLACLYFAWRERAEYLSEMIGGPELDRLGELLACPRHRYWGVFRESDVSYRVRLRAVVTGVYVAAKCDTVRR